MQGMEALLAAGADKSVKEKHMRVNAAELVMMRQVAFCLSNPL